MMRRLWWAAAALTFVGCGRILQGSDGTSSASLDCTYGKIATVPGLPLGLASTGNTVFVVSDDADGVIGDLRAITSDGAVHLLVSGNATAEMSAAGSSLAFSRRYFDGAKLTSETIEIVNPDLSITQIDRTSDAVAQVDAIISDAAGDVFWRRWGPGSDPTEPTILGIPALMKYENGNAEVVTTNFGSATNVVSDGTDFFGLTGATETAAETLERLPIGGAPELALVTGGFPDIILGVDDTNVVYLDWQLKARTVAKKGGTPNELAQVPFTMSTPPVLYGHFVYWAQDNGDGTSTLSRVATSGGGVQTISSQTAVVGALTADGCGVVYALTDSANPGETSTSIYRTKL